MRIGEVARLSGCSPETIRHYEKLGLLETPLRSTSGYRRYDVAAVDRLGFIRHGRELGLDLRAIGELLALADHPDADCRAVDRIASRHLERIEARIASLQQLAEELRAMVTQCRGGRVAECRIIEALFRRGTEIQSPE
ncbi:Transcriptional regulator, MerR family [Thioalkalivibrio nitratireducens DSM 14787]|uniref:Transcriptional regulator, MerR family n=1 Tax=Thioalkalivibrio nitratireducens (strain DSM 14787 / UNIQEM 213 / ALEN2) TaxID=1255043 RepID=L0E0C2_THIND|nr:Transcriptional regulator, MerR family [Thioalkalivibrio nitratireducens DSM 14787]